MKHRIEHKCSFCGRTDRDREVALLMVSWLDQETAICNRCAAVIFTQFRDSGTRGIMIMPSTQVSQRKGVMCSFCSRTEQEAGLLTISQKDQESAVCENCAATAFSQSLEGTQGIMVMPNTRTERE